LLAAGICLLALGASACIGAYRLSFDLDYGPVRPSFGPWLGLMLGRSGFFLPRAVALGGVVAGPAVGLAFARGRWRARAAAVASGLGLAAALTGVTSVLPGPVLETDAAVVALLVAGALLVALALRVAWKRPRREPAAPVADPPREEVIGALCAPVPVEHAPSYRLVGAGPPVTAEEAERAALAVEVRVTWGSELLRVEHLDPPRRFTAGERGADLAMDADRLGAALASIVTVASGRASVVAPPGAVVSIRGRQGEPYEATRAAAIPLELGTRVTLTFPPRGAGTAYRAAGGEEGVVAAPVAVEIALTRAGRVVGRAPSPRAHARLAASTTVVACAALGFLTFASRSAGAPDDDPDYPSPDTVRFLIEARQRIDDRLEEEPWIWGSGGSFLRDNARYGEDGCGFRVDPARASAGAWLDCHVPAPIPFSGFLRSPTISGAELTGPDVLVGVGDAAPDGVLPLLPPKPLSGIGFRSWGSSSSPARKRPVPRARVTIAIREIEGALAPELVHRGLRPLGRDARACYADGLRVNPDLTGAFRVVFAIGQDGAEDALRDANSDLPDRGVISCVLRAVAPLRFTPPRAGVARVTLQLSFAPE
jgi:hypothetical protein